MAQQGEIMKNEPNRGKTTGIATLEWFLDDVDAKIKDFSQFANAAAGEAHLKAHLGLLDVGDFWTKQKAELVKAIGYLREAQSRPKAALEEGRIELYFGKADAKEAIAELRQRLEQTTENLRDLGRKAESDTKAATQRLVDAYESIKNKLLN